MRVTGGHSIRRIDGPVPFVPVTGGLSDIKAARMQRAMLVIVTLVSALLQAVGAKRAMLVIVALLIALLQAVWSRGQGAEAVAMHEIEARVLCIPQY